MKKLMVALMGLGLMLLLLALACSREVKPSINRIEVVGRTKDAVEVTVITTYRGVSPKGEMTQRHAVYLALAEMMFEDIGDLDKLMKKVSSHSNPNITLAVSVMRRPDTVQ